MIDITKPEDFMLRDGREIVAFYESGPNELLVVFRSSNSVMAQHVDATYGNQTSAIIESPYDVIPRSKKKWRALYESGAVGAPWDSKELCDKNKGPTKRACYLTWTDPKDVKTYEIVPLEEEQDYKKEVWE